MDDVTKFELVKEIGLAMADYVMQRNKFNKDLTDTPTHRDELVTAFDCTTQIQAQVSSAEWIKGQATS